jgi:hypothetical protein
MYEEWTAERIRMTRTNKGRELREMGGSGIERENEDVSFVYFYYYLQFGGLVKRVLSFLCFLWLWDLIYRECVYLGIRK